MSVDRVHVPSTDRVSRAINDLSRSASRANSSLEARVAALEASHHLPETHADFSEAQQVSDSSAWVLIHSNEYRDFHPDHEALFVVFGYDGHMGGIAEGHIRVHQNDGDAVIYDDEVSRTSAGIMHTHPMLWQPDAAHFTLHFEFHGTAVKDAILDAWFWFTQRVVKEPE